VRDQNKKQVGCQAAIAGKPAPTGKNTHGSQSGRSAASFWLLLWIFLPHREAEWRGQEPLVTWGFSK
ncbi:hypothetical protein, partial [Pseudomonas jessenii]|uniref:hypothetical protein n=1 Tax=Pseudomonas jessenii TaxID=77298 RepID=UPI0019D47129